MDRPDAIDFRPPRLLRSPHLQTFLASRIAWQRHSSGARWLAGATRLTVPCRHGARLQALVNADRPGTPQVILLHGWLGHADSPYICRAAVALHRAGFNVARLLLRDHGGTAALNPELFNAARLDEVMDACNYLAALNGGAASGLLGFSLGGNFALRVAGHTERAAAITACLAVCPVVDPAMSAAALDAGWAPYRRYFVRKWRAAFAEKQAAFPERYDFSPTRSMNSLGALTDYLVARYTPYADATDYYARYTLTAPMLEAIEIPARILAAADDPVIPRVTVEPLRVLNGSLVDLCAAGGHCGFLENYRLHSAVDAYALSYFQRLRQAAA